LVSPSVTKAVAQAADTGTLWLYEDPMYVSDSKSSSKAHL